MDAYHNSSFITRRNREIGSKVQPGERAQIINSLSTNIKAHHIWDPRKTTVDSDHGGVFNFDFSKDGSMLGVACERRSVLLFDSLNGRVVARKPNAHMDCVNCIKFLDDRLFATCSDDTTVALWDTRYLKHKIQTFRGHTNWVKNIEYDASQGVLLTSGFDGCIFTWDFNRYSTEVSSNSVFYMNGLMRSKLSPDFSKLIISTHEGYIIVIHNLELSTLSEDLRGFKPNMYRLMQQSQSPLRIGLMYNNVFEQKRNRVEFISDWPIGIEANTISSLQVHPQGWCILSRNTDMTENTEWTCVHDIQAAEGEWRNTSCASELSGTAPYTSSAYCSSTNTPACSSTAPSRRHPRNSRSNENIFNVTRENSNNLDFPGSILASTSTLESQQHNNQRSLNQADDVAEEYSRTESDRRNQNRDIAQNTIEQEMEEREHSNSLESDSENGNETLDRSDLQSSNVAPRSENSDMIVLGNDIPFFNRILPMDRNTRNSLIQIRRGAAQEDGSFSFSVSVHTSNGQSFEFNQDDLASDNDEADVVPIEPTLRRAQRNVVQRPLTHALIAANPNNSIFTDAVVRAIEVTTDNISDHLENDNSDSIDSDGDDTIEPVLDFENNYLVEEAGEEYVADYNSDDNYVANTESDDSYEADEPFHDEQSEIDILNSLEETENQESDNDLFRNTNFARVRRSRDQTTDRPYEANHSRIQNAETTTAFRPLASFTDSQNSGHLLDSHSRNRSLMFFVNSNDQNRQRLLHLRFHDLHTESENKILQKKIHMNKKRLLGYAEECNVGRGFIKEVAFSKDGRLISSPFGFGLRLFAFDSHCNELCDCVPASTVKLYEVTSSMAHCNCVVATQFSPTHSLVVSGCLDGKIAFHQPVL